MKFIVLWDYWVNKLVVVQWPPVCLRQFQRGDSYMNKSMYASSILLTGVLGAGCTGTTVSSLSSNDAVSSTQSIGAVASSSSAAITPVSSSQSSLNEQMSSLSSDMSSSSTMSSSSLAPPVVFELSTTSFTEHGALPAAYSCEGKTFFDGQDISPALSWTAGPEGTQHYALAFVDTTITQGQGDPTNGFHWVMWNIPTATTSVPEAMGSGDGGVAGASQMSPHNGYDQYFGPCPSWNFCNNGNIRDNHNYEYIVYAMDSQIQGATIRERIEWLELNALDKAEITVTSDAAPECPMTVSLVEEGRTLWNNHCSGCHRNERTGATFDDLQWSFSAGTMSAVPVSTFTASDENLRALADYLTR